MAVSEYGKRKTNGLRLFIFFVACVVGFGGWAIKHSHDVSSEVLVIPEVPDKSTQVCAGVKYENISSACGFLLHDLCIPIDIDKKNLMCNQILTVKKYENNNEPLHARNWLLGIGLVMFFIVFYIMNWDIKFSANVFATFLLLAALYPQIMIIDQLQAAAVDGILSSWVGLAMFGLLLTVPVKAQFVKESREKKQNEPEAWAGFLVSVLPYFLHVWMIYQIHSYNDEITDTAAHSKNIAGWAWPLLTALFVIMYTACFFYIFKYEKKNDEQKDIIILCEKLQDVLKKTKLEQNTLPRLKELKNFLQKKCLPKENAVALTVDRPENFFRF